MALYRKYRPATFAEVVGQSHVTEPLSTALDSGRINHAYLFSGPRGCGKTSSARILARSLNCVHGPTSTPCGVCDSCVSLAPGGPGNLDVTELDAATHNGVDDMRELRERAFYAPAESRYRVFIIDEAHMISTAGFNALLKIVEEPPEHLIFIFATTEPEKLLQTIRSRTHNYPFRLLTPPDMRGLLASVVEGEGVAVEDSVYPLVVRAGGGSPRDSLSIMDQLLAGAGPDGVTYTRALALLGVTDLTLINDAVVALAEQDQAGLFGVVDEVIEAGYDPRRFAEDLLDRFRDLLVLQAVPDAIDRGLVNAPADAKEALEEQARMLGQATLTRCAALVNEGLAQMRGATAPRLLLEILCARMALPAAGLTVEALAQRVEALEQGRGGSPAALGASAAAGQAPNLASGRKYERPSRRRQPEPPQPSDSDGAGPGAGSHPQEAHAAAEAAQAPQGAPAVETPNSAAPAAPVEPAQQAAPAAPAAPAASTESAQPATDAEPAVKPAEQHSEEEATGAETAEPPEVAEARRAREILDRNRRAQQLSESTSEQPTSVPSASEQPADGAAQSSPRAQSAQDAEPKQEAAPQTATTLSAEQWSEVLERVKNADLSAWIALRGAELAEEQPTSGEVHVTHHTGALANFVNAERNALIYRGAIQEVAGMVATVVANGNRRGSRGAGHAGGASGADPSGTGSSTSSTSNTSPAQNPTPPHDAKEPTPPGKAEAPRPSHNPVPAEKDTDVATIRTAASSALERAAAMEAALQAATGVAGGGGRGGVDEKKPEADTQASERSNRRRARIERVRAKKQYNQENGFNGVPLPEEPPEDPWDAPDGPGSAAPQEESGARRGQQNHQSQQAARPSQQDPNNERQRIEDEMLDDLRSGPGQRERRSPLEIAGELVEKHLGGTRVR